MSWPFLFFILTSYIGRVFAASRHAQSSGRHGSVGRPTSICRLSVDTKCGPTGVLRPFGRPVARVELQGHVTVGSTRELPSRHGPRLGTILGRHLQCSRTKVNLRRECLGKFLETCGCFIRFSFRLTRKPRVPNANIVTVDFRKTIVLTCVKIHLWCTQRMY